MEYINKIYVSEKDPYLKEVSKIHEDLSDKVLKINLDLNNKPEDEDANNMLVLMHGVEMIVLEHNKREEWLKIEFSEQLPLIVLDIFFDHYVPIPYVKN